MPKGIRKRLAARKHKRAFRRGKKAVQKARPKKGEIDLDPINPDPASWPSGPTLLKEFSSYSAYKKALKIARGRPAIAERLAVAYEKAPKFFPGRKIAKGVSLAIGVTIPSSGKDIRKLGGKTTLKPSAEQLNAIKQLLELNKEKGLGLRFASTIRFVEGKTPTIIARERNIYDWKKTRKLSKKRADDLYDSYQTDLKSQMDIGRRNGFLIQAYAFSPVMDKKTKKLVAVITDLGEVKKLKKK